MNRRQFLRGAVALGMSVTAGLVGCGASQSTSSPRGSSEQARVKADAGSGEPPQTPAAAATPSDLAGRTVTLNNGIDMPCLGIGTYYLSNAQAEESVYAALMAGTRLIDTARIYGNEEGVGRGIARAGVPRDEIFLTTKLWTADFADAAAAIDGSLARLGQDYVDLLLLHHEDTYDEDAYRAMEDAVAAGKVRSIGISNFYEDGFDRICAMASIQPGVLQNETHPYFQERSMREHLASSDVGTLLESWFPLGGKDNCDVLFSDKTIVEIASNHGVSPAQALIRWHLQTGNVCIPGSGNPDHIREDANVWDFELSPDEMAAIDALDRNQRFAWY